ncbi:hypothetical protein EDB86DRAFT_943115 [Lactarius hatsudake]|nr:hypothetical protein EDB86DRAFT_943115 [Lactarius hatsudake]
MSSIPPQMRRSRRQKERSMQHTDVRTSKTPMIGDSPPLRPRQISQRARRARERANRVCINIFKVIYALPPTPRLQVNRREQPSPRVQEIAQEARAQNDGDLIVHGDNPSRPLPVVTSTSSSSLNAPPLGRRQIAQRARRERERANCTVQRSNETPAMRNDTANEKIVDESQRFSQDSPSLQPRRMAQRARRPREKQIRTTSSGLNTSNQRAQSMDREFTEDDINLEEVCQCGGIWDHDDNAFDVNFTLMPTRSDCKY